MNKQIVTAYVRFVQVKGGKRRPILITDELEDGYEFFKITTKFATKSRAMQKWYFEITDYEGTGLLKHSWIDTYHRYFLPKGVTSIKPIGNLSSYDETRLTAFVMRQKK